MGFEGEANLRLLNRIRQGMVAHIRSKPGCQANDVRCAVVRWYLWRCFVENTSGVAAYQVLVFGVDAS